MDRQALAVLIPVISIFFTGLIAFSFTRLGKAVARRIEGGGSADLAERLTRMELDHDRLQRDLAEAHDRLDYAERLLTRDAGRADLPGR